MKKLFLTYAVYFLIGSLLIFFLPQSVSKDKIEEFEAFDYYGETSDDRVIIFDNPFESALARLYIIEQAKETLDIAYFSIESGETANVFFGALFDAADRGVQVNILLDGMFHGLRMQRRALIYAMDNHPNMHLKFYEKFNPLLPWTLNNRMHDKYIIADDTMALIGGRNIGDKYFAPEWYEDEITNDRDVLVFNLENNKSVVSNMKDYFDSIYHHPYSKDVQPITKWAFKKKAQKLEQDMRYKAKLAREQYKETFAKVVDLEAISQPTQKISFIHNPITRFNKEPWVLKRLSLLLNQSDALFIQSPYTILNYKMRQHFELDDLKDKKVTLLTNSLLSTPNLPAFSGYMNYRQKIAQNIDVLELQSTDSLHSKAFLFNDDLVAIGSFNLDTRSGFLSTESMVVIHSKQAVEHFGINIYRFTDHSLRVGDDNDYIKEAKLKPSLSKRVIYKVMSYVMRLFENLL